MRTKPRPESIDQYISAFPPKVQRLLQKVRRTIRKAAPEATETIAYRIPTFRMPGNLVHFAGYAHHIGFYPTSSGIAAFEDELGGYVHARGSVQFPLSAPIPLGLIERITAFRVRECLAKPGRKPRATKVAKAGARAGSKSRPASARPRRPGA
jgi:uncharacterized protein YdhG (YjbR/CyaY superfamily)